MPVLYLWSRGACDGEPTLGSGHHNCVARKMDMAWKFETHFLESSPAFKDERDAG